ncbi:hypothetical protein EXU30_00115 [Shewanella maritima]|uniref:Uncharacterized protein n=1 Tax=Shewanella maritima TaxID=2520507 RepID=A0A411PCK1_9GAMM|nr:hypothetical protein [Shewanella maritima]QBF81273.1 hypothetical protein EXU30_00115 [Shewanella maritima]
MQMYYRNAHNYLYLCNHKDKFQTLFNNDHRAICDFFDVDKSTAYRWINEGKPTNKTALRLLDIAASGFMPCNEAWNGYFIFNGRLVTKSGYVLQPWEIEHLSEAAGHDPIAERLVNQPRNFKPWRDREPAFVKKLHRK